MFHQLLGREKKYRYKEDDWKWWEANDPRAVRNDNKWIRALLADDTDEGDAPAPSPEYGSEPPVHTEYRSSY